MSSLPSINRSPAPPSAAVPAPSRFVAALGRRALGAGAETRALARLLARTVRCSIRAPLDLGAVVEQMYEAGNRSVFFLTVVMGFIGMILVLQAGLQSRRIVPDLSMLGPTYLPLLVRELAPSMTAMMLATRVGAGIAAQIGSMVVTEQVDALRMCSADPVDYLVKPRFLASLVVTFALAVWSGAVALATGLLTAEVVFEIRSETFLSFRLVQAADLVVGATKCLAYGAAVPVVASYCGLNAFGGSEGVGSATTRAVVSGLLAVIALNLVISTAGFLVFGS